jgi:mannosyltransferase
MDGRSSQRRSQKLIIGILLLLILLLAFGLRFYHLGAQSFWNDEGTSVAMAQRDLVTIARDAAQDIHPPLYYWLLSGWVGLFGTGEAAVRSLSALSGVVVLALTFALGRRLAGPWIALAAALLAAIHPFQVYYAQEARMYMLLAALTAGAVLALVHIVQGASWPAWLALVLLEAAGLYTHYSFVFIVLVLNLAYALWLAFTWRQQPDVRRAPAGWRALNWVLSQVGVLLLYLPWLSTAFRQVTTWPHPAGTTALFSALAEAWRWLVFGSTIQTGTPAIPSSAPAWIAGAVIVPLIVAVVVIVAGLLSLAMGWVGSRTVDHRWSAGLLALWLGLPVLLVFVLGLYREAYLKFLLVVTPAVTILLACGLLAPLRSRRPASSTDQETTSPPRSSRIRPVALRLVQLLAALVLLVPSLFALNNYYADPAYARDDYRAIAAYIDAVGRPGDAILLNAPGQQEVFRYYYRGSLPVYALPKDRPLDPAATEAALVELARPGGRVFAVLWATAESDPGRFIEGWLDTHAYKALDSWYGNVRLTAYAVPDQMPSAPTHALDIHLQNPETGDDIALLGYSLGSDKVAAPAGVSAPAGTPAADIAEITLFWQAEQTPGRRYKVFLHVLDDQDQIVGQRDSEPGGGARLTTLWQPGEIVADPYGVQIHPATPPGVYRVEVGMYDPETGVRLTTPEGAGQVWLDPLMVKRPSAPVPAAALGMQHARGARFGELALLGYDLYKLGFAHLPDMPLRPGDVLHANLYWQAEAQPDGDWQVALSLVDSDSWAWTGIQAEPVAGYPTSEWQTGDVWRGQFNLAVPEDAAPGRYRLRVQAFAPDGTASEPFFTRPFIVER